MKSLNHNEFKELFEIPNELNEIVQILNEGVKYDLMNPIGAIKKKSTLLRKLGLNAEQIQLTLELTDLGFFTKEQITTFNELNSKESRHNSLKQNHELFTKTENKLSIAGMLKSTLDRIIYLGEGQFGVAGIVSNPLESLQRSKVIKIIYDKNPIAMGALELELENHKKFISFRKQEDLSFDNCNTVIPSINLSFNEEVFFSMDYVKGLTLQKLLIFQQYANRILSAKENIQNYSIKNLDNNPLFNQIIFKCRFFGISFLNLSDYDFLELLSYRDIMFLLHDEGLQNISFNTHKVFTNADIYNKCLQQIKVLSSNFDAKGASNYIDTINKRLRKSKLEHPDPNTANIIFHTNKNNDFQYGLIDFGVPKH